MPKKGLARALMERSILERPTLGSGRQEPTHAPDGDQNHTFYFIHPSQGPIFVQACTRIWQQGGLMDGDRVFGPRDLYLFLAISFGKKHPPLGQRWQAARVGR